MLRPLADNIRMAQFGILLENTREFLTSRKFLWIITGIVGIVGVLYLLFISLFFDPYEDDLGDMATLIPREVDYFVRWKGAGQRFDGFPVPTIWGSLEGSSVWKEMQDSGAAEEWDESFGISDAMEELGKLHALTPAGLSMESDLFREVALAGHGEFGLGPKFNGVLMLRVSFKVKAGVALLGFDFVRDKLPKSLGIESLGNGRYHIPQFGPFGMQDAYLSRVQDVLLLASRPEWLDTAEQLNNQSGQDSLALASQFSDNVEAHLSSGDQTVESFFRWEKMKKQFPSWPTATNQPSFTERIGGSFFDTEMLRHVAGYWLPGDRFDIRLSGNIDAKKARTSFLKSWVNSGLVSVNKLKKFAGVAPASSFFFGAVGGDPSKVLVEMQNSIDPEFRRLLDEVLVETRFNGLTSLLKEAGLAFEPGMALVLRKNTFKSTGDSREVDHNSAPVPCFAIMGKLRDRGIYQDLLDFFLNNAYRFSDNSSQVKLERVDLRGGTSATAFTSPIIPGTGELLVFELKATRTIVICNSFRFMEEILSAAFTTDGSRGAESVKLSAAVNFKPAMKAQRNGANLFLWFDPSESWHWLEQLSQGLARDEFQVQMDAMFRKERPAEIRRQRERLFPGENSISSVQNREIQDAVDEALSARYKEQEAVLLPSMALRSLNGLLPMKWLDWVSLGLKTSRRQASLLVSGEVDID